MGSKLSALIVLWGLSASALDCESHRLTWEWSANDCRTAKAEIYEKLLVWARQKRDLCRLDGGTYTYLGKENPLGPECAATDLGRRFVQVVSVACAKAKQCTNWLSSPSESRSSNTISVTAVPVNHYAAPSLGRVVLNLPLKDTLTETTGQKPYAKRVTLSQGGGYFSGDSFLRLSQSSAFDARAESFTTEFFFRAHGWKNDVTFWNRQGPEGRSHRLTYELRAEGKRALIFRWDERGTENFLGCTAELKPWEWYHIAVSRSGALLRLFINGVLCSSAKVTASLREVTAPWEFGRANETQVEGLYLGQLAHLRMVRGQAMYRQPFTIGALDRPVVVPFCGNGDCAFSHPVLTAIAGRVEKYLGKSAWAYPALDFDRNRRISAHDAELVFLFPDLNSCQDGVSAWRMKLRLLTFARRHIGLGKQSPYFLKELDYDHSGRISLNDVRRFHCELDALMTGIHSACES